MPKLAPWPKDVLKPWDELAPEAKKLFIRQVEVFAAYAAYNDHEIGRVIQHFEDLGRLDNTLVIYINGDNGTSAEGGPLGTPNEVAFFNGINEMPVDVQMKWYDVWGTEQTYNHMSAGWSWAFDTPFDWFKQNASRLGGINQNMVVSWPARIKDKGGLREQFVHVIDVVPTILEATGIKAPEAVDGIRQAPIEGTSFAYTFDAKNAKSGLAAQDAVLRDDGPVGALRRRLAAQHEGQPRAVAGLRRGQPGPAEQPGVPALRPEEGLHPDPRTSPRKHPQKVKEMRQKFVAEAKKYQVFPMDASVAARIVAPRPNITAGRTEFVYTRPMIGSAAGRLAATPERLLHDHRRHRGAAGRRRGNDPDLGRALRRLRLLPAQGQARLPVEPGRPRAGEVGGRRSADARHSTRSSSSSSTMDSASGRWRSTT